MTTPDATDFMVGVIEGFYGPPWSQAERLELFQWMAPWGLNTYIYAPKDDLCHRALWRQPYDEAKTKPLREMIAACQQHGLRFLYALSPGLDIRYSDANELAHLQRRFEQLLALGCHDFALLFDDIPGTLPAADQARWGSLAAAQSHMANAMWTWIQTRQPGARLCFCPTAYCSRMAQSKLGGPDYLADLGRELAPEVEIFWTGPEIVSREITVGHVRELQRLLRRKPLIWDNLHANDYDGRRFYCGPYSGRPPALRAEVRGLLSNPNNEFPLNYVALRTLAAFAQCSGTWDPRLAYLSAMREWLKAFAALGQPVLLDDLILLGDCYYLPHEEGPEAQTLVQRAQRLLQGESEDWQAEAAVFLEQSARLQALCGQLAQLQNRPLFHALSRRIWDLREELDLLEQYVKFKGQNPGQSESLVSHSHLPGTCRGGMIARLQKLLEQQPDGSFRPSHDLGSAPQAQDSPP